MDTIQKVCDKEIIPNPKKLKYDSIKTIIYKYKEKVMTIDDENEVFHDSNRGICLKIIINKKNKVKKLLLAENIFFHLYDLRKENITSILNY